MLLAAGRADAQFHLEDSLSGGTMGNPVGGRFDADGWHVTARTDRIWYALPRLVAGYVEFTLSGVTMESLGSVDNEIFAMYEAGYGITEPIPYSDFRENHYKCMLRVYGNTETGREGYQKLMWGMCPAGDPGRGACACGRSFFEEPFGGTGGWDGSPQRIRIEWGAGVTRYFRNGGLVLTINWADSGLAFGPSELHLSLGTSRPSATDAQLPVGAVFSNLRIDGTEGPLAVCPGVSTPDAGTPAMDSGTPSENVIEVPAVEDVTVDPTLPATVYPDPLDLAVGSMDSEFYVRFRVPSFTGRVVQAQLLLNSATNASAAGSGASLYRAGNDTWSEATLAWGARPGPSGARLARVDGISVDQPYAFALPAGTVTGPGSYSFAVLPEASDTNSAHFDAHEVSLARGPRLRLTIDPTMSADDAGVATPDVVPSADATLPPDDTGVARDANADGMRGDAGATDARGPGVVSGGCNCRAAAPASSARGARGVGAVLAALALARARSRARR